MNTVVVTGGNRGIGLEICRQLDALGYQVILGSRDFNKGIKASCNLSKNVIVKQLDVTDEKSIHALFNFVKNESGKLDVLINNAGIGTSSFKSSTISDITDKIKTNFHGVYQVIKKVNPLMEKMRISPERNNASNIPIIRVKEIMDTNFYGPWRMIQIFIPLLLKSTHGRIINISSGMGELKSLSGFLPDYSLSKASLNALTIMFSNELNEKGIKVNAICPGWVKTDMGGTDAPRTVIEGADTAVWLATVDDSPTGKFFRDRLEINW
jgi:NAD(P)-dependent dehydrogenase (short-subunit alcohol dehydrogenase family)